MSYNDAIIVQPHGPRNTCSTATDAFVRFFTESGGFLDARCGLAEYAEMGVGMVAMQGIEEDSVLFRIPRHLLLGVNNSVLPGLCRQADQSSAASTSGVNGGQTKEGEKRLSWDEDVSTGWLPLITTMMWEQWRTSPEGSSVWQNQQQQLLSSSSSSSSSSSTPTQSWGPYFDVLPATFDTPMFWEEKELEALKGTTIVDKIGKGEASKDYEGVVAPYIRSRPEIFFGGALASEPEQEQIMARFYSIEHFHLMGSRILSRSFHVKTPEAGQEGPVGDIMDQEGQADEDEMEEDDDDDAEGDSDSDEEEEEEKGEAIENVTMVPMADMLNARFGCDNARLFYKKDVLEMRATRNIAAEEQIWNTYGEPPSSDLLRRYGYVDLGNVNDVVEISVSHLIGACMDLEQIAADDNAKRSERESALMERAEWWASEGLDEVFALSYAFPPSSQPPHRPEPSAPSAKELKAAASAFSEEILVAARILCLSEENFDKAQKKDRMPNARIEAEESRGSTTKMGVAELLIRALERRLQKYPTTMQEDEELVYGHRKEEVKSLRTRNAIVVRLSEKRILEDNMRVLRGAIELGRAPVPETKKRAPASESNGRAGKKGRK